MVSCVGTSVKGQANKNIAEVGVVILRAAVDEEEEWHAED